MIKLTTLLLLVCCLSSIAEDPKWSARVSVYITGPTKSLRLECEGALKRELRKLPDVVVTDIRPTYRLRGDIEEIRSLRNQQLGYCMCLVVTAPFQTNILSAVGEQVSDPVSEYLESFVQIDKLMHLNGSDVASICLRVAHRIDNEVFEEERKGFDQGLEIGLTKTNSVSIPKLH